MKLGYARISTTDQDASMQVEAFISASVDSGAREAKERPGMKGLNRVAGSSGSRGGRPKLG